ncbi:hypothetical protein AKJ58_01300 [candidate division MSBL1 archaeon SCGC-AAA385D11]|uniref:Uncharacterized protein n=1 Tax=candidate division MSBL1 archaeon SCGC-AAA385D11 TaxID=1698286 RepID=A0A133VNI2_9EURY|nr:hypothetical protein AKJ58_01300 [candidate division MSBL1 archaeon SCGC-AAA385D11]
MGFLYFLKGSSEKKGKKPKSKEGSHKKDKYYCVTCGTEISKGEYEDNEGQCYNCVAEDTVYAAPEEFGF